MFVMVIFMLGNLLILNSTYRSHDYIIGHCILFWVYIHLMNHSVLYINLISYLSILLLHLFYWCVNNISVGDQKTSLAGPRLPPPRGEGLDTPTMELLQEFLLTNQIADQTLRHVRVNSSAYAPRNYEQFKPNVEPGVILKLPQLLLKDEQEEAITHFALGRDVFVSLPTGYGKSFCYQALDCLRKVEKSIVMVVCLLVALMKDQVVLPASFLTSNLG